MPEAEFDSVAPSYEAEHAASIRLSGEDPDYFARYKIEDVATALHEQGAMPQRILDFGGGVGNSVKHMREFFPSAKIVLLDPSAKSLELAARYHTKQADFVTFDGEHIPFEGASFDLVFVACVFHHIPEKLHVPVLCEIRRVLTRNGNLFLFEHNPLNPLTRHAVRNCAFDKNAVLIKAPEMRKRILAAGFAKAETTNRLFFPRGLARLRPLERFLVTLPLGAQYFVQAKNAAA